ncbi:hypothetical protein AJ85_08900 [Alkalihalobacillus alcalophilus ATCC 27647 = CGMCC 1.3604]|uniref:UPF0398 protein AJ85_08900 n=1 Tax=Alkalihalobacillus alcalophilus ATCC 27647 = CGMCC 1.3604 TaxID=1218173 RepID=A0A094WKL8_ALKAL|nr:DUF1273 domain-containing protein [Alkalihalobacillus alcalophilus]KGA97401.1 hypothetical protein BALCAV_0210395 [Alkalihalobacillus alcalophilus ATCC 27647 = CGMCC 1.3604]MED1561804.1 DUF1273 domain-containing protein [Alkalihalobacillus alcalophilus]THG90770.1 hypothetical protein AJ85_08900 [Alkalihalobacillus alcalophilus ATCC 27647 = CGMCC 1.3604]
MKTVAVTGYKAFELGIFDQKHIGITYIRKAFRQRLLTLIEEGLEWVIISGQLGVELWVAEEVFALKEKSPHLKLAVLTPFLEQESGWKEATQSYYREIIAKADFVDSITKRPYESPQQLKQKNEFIIQKVEGLIVLYDEEKQGSPKYYLEVAKRESEKREFYLSIITPYDLNVIIEDEQYNSEQ